ncbi:precorrin-3B C(17)-methyltransferase [Ferrovum sp.]|uniref:precorrin-3B C(17)-methyltransferase n=1 Tax=Ferrovum sp. TaxID=2609467 RepID=UPI00262D2322|nr:precorrin-3B C(17)-methyltransferase [Ferrovum sp.]
MKTGKILMVGFGPGATEHMTYRARAAIAEADVVIGYSTYIKLVQDLLVGKEIIRKGMTEEIDRCVEAYEQACQGKTVALISSGDIGIYGMAGPTYEVLLQAGWTPESEIRVEVIPGASALNACASLVGAPLTHDFCSISLSDLLTPWPVIAQRLRAAARGDFVIALYNPKSGRRTQQIVEAQRLLLEYRDPGTPVAVVKSAYRRRQHIQLVTLETMADQEIGMLTTVLIGNSSTFVRAGLMVTPRGYTNKYEGLTGEAKPGEQAGRSLTLGLEGWKEFVRVYLQTYPDHSLRQVADHFDAPLAQILEAVAGNPEDDALDRVLACHFAPTELELLLQEMHRWGKLRAVVRHGGAVAELLISARDLTFESGRLNLVHEYFHLHVDVSSLAHGWFVRQGTRQAGIYFTDAHGDFVVSFLLTKDGEGRWSAEEVKSFYRASATMGTKMVKGKEGAGA